ncbi:glycosyltransferase [Tropicibacter sp. R16_0]|uniref:glycosyltransferase family protein n=1 Tax=Tropicibacter sp. R16_0 TaxID=2821102 RepID=UPI001ADB8AB1|nr:glycosyltransferase [Tropicibacter sp. R16_0]MBO9448714.1 glycosyltransferase [Tropicibacter sp. R16_0]
MKVLIAVTHLLGSGHLSRALTLGRAFAQEGHEVVVISGGFAVPQLDSRGVDLRQLPPLRSDGTNFTRLLTDLGEVADAPYLAARSKAMVEMLQEVQPDALITELFPFGRRVLRHEFQALLKAARALPKRPLICCSIRDILAPPSRPEKVRKTDAILLEFFDAVLVHSDPNATRLEVSWPVSEALAEKLIYTGYVAPPAASVHPDGLGTGEILVSAGGGTVGEPIFRAAIEAARKITNRRWRLLVGGSDSTARISMLQQDELPENVIIEAARPDFRQMLHHAAASVSMCGYNTALDLLQAGTPAVLIPFDDGQEVEQTLRARSLADLPGFEVLPSADLTDGRLARSIEDAISAPLRSRQAAEFNGALKTVKIIESRLEACL